MARGNCIIVSAEPGGKFMEGYVGVSQTLKPGTIVQRDATIALKGGRHTYKAFTPGTDGEHPLGPLYVLLNDYLRGGAVTDSFTDGDRCFLYTPAPGDELNLLVANLAGTADDHALGEKLMIDTGTGKLIATTGSPESEPFELLEAITDPVADTLAWVVYSGY